MILDDHSPRRLRCGPDGTDFALYHPAHTYGPDAAEGYVRALIRSDNGRRTQDSLEVTSTPDGVAYHVIATARLRPRRVRGGDDLSTVALLWNINGCSELQVLEYADGTLSDPIPLPNPVAGELSISAGGSMVAMTVQGPDMPRTVELVDPRTRSGSASTAGPAAVRSHRYRRWKR